MSREQQLFDALEGALTLIDMSKAPDWFVIMARAAIATPPAAQEDVFHLEHMAVAEEGKLRWMTGRKMQNCELYARPDGAAIREKLFARQGVKQEPFTQAQRERLYRNADESISKSMTLAAFHRAVRYTEESHRITSPKPAMKEFK